MQYFLFGCLVVSAVRFSAVLKGMADGLEDADGSMMDVVNDESDADIDDSSNAVSGFVGPHPLPNKRSLMLCTQASPSWPLQSLVETLPQTQS